ncbi:MAG: hypothetical protein QM779_02695 [Propionicimonas sp.]
MRTQETYPFLAPIPTGSARSAAHRVVLTSDPALSRAAGVR